jgi:uncharacterized protein (DUF58 family)
MVTVKAKIFSYSISWRARSQHAALHRGVQTGVGSEYRGNAAFVDHPDARRIDIRQTIRDPAEQVHVRLFNQNSPISVFAVCDLSGSMSFTGEVRKLDLVAEIVESIVHTAHAHGDRAGFVSFSDRVQTEWFIRPTANLHDFSHIIKKLRSPLPIKGNTKGFRDIRSYVGTRRALVFLISDFHIPLKELDLGLSQLSGHQVVPIVLWDGAEHYNLPRFGLHTIVDPETGEEKTLFFRESLREKFKANFEDRRQKLRKLFTKHNTLPHYVEDKFDASKLTQYFQ